MALLLTAFLSWLLCVLCVHGFYRFLYARVIPPKNPHTSVRIQLVEATVVAGGILILFVLTGRSWVALVLGLLLYVCFAVVTVQKIVAFEAPLYPRDVLAIPDLIRSWDSLISVAAPILSVLGVGLVLGAVAWQFGPVVHMSTSTQLIILGGLLTAASLTWYGQRDGTIDRWLATRDVEFQSWIPLRSALRHGLLLELVLEASRAQKPMRVEGYDRESIQKLVREYHLYPSPTEVAPKERVNVIIYLIESFVDPWRLGLMTTRDPIPEFRKLLSSHGHGHVISPVVGTASANAEFELLTGMSMRFIRRDLVPYKHAIRRPVPGLASELGRHGYHCAAMQVVSLAFFNYREAYSHLGFQDVQTLWSREGIETDIAGRCPGDDELVDAIIEESQRKQPYFIFAFPNSTHHPWNYSGYLSSDLDVVRQSPTREQNWTKTYVNAIHSADRSISRLVSHFEQRPEKTLILILGDHVPALGHLPELSGRFPAPGLDELGRQRQLHEVPAVLWSNYGLKKKDFELSMNMLATRILDAIGIQPSGFLALNDVLRRRIGVLSVFVRDAQGSYRFDVPAEYADVVRDYELLQYDVLLGDAYLRQAGPA